MFLLRKCFERSVVPSFCLLVLRCALTNAQIPPYSLRCFLGTLGFARYNGSDPKSPIGDNASTPRCHMKRIASLSLQCGCYNDKPPSAENNRPRACDYIRDQTVGEFLPQFGLHTLTSSYREPSRCTTGFQTTLRPPLPSPQPRPHPPLLTKPTTINTNGYIHCRWDF